MLSFGDGPHVEDLSFVCEADGSTFLREILTSRSCPQRSALCRAPQATVVDDAPCQFRV